MSGAGAVGGGLEASTGAGGVGMGAGARARTGADTGEEADTGVALAVTEGEAASAGTRGGVGATGAGVLDLTPTVELGLGAHASSSKPLATGGTLEDLRIGRSGVEDLTSGVCTLGMLDWIWVEAEAIAGISTADEDDLGSRAGRPRR